jgi:hypothetical protein
LNSPEGTAHNPGKIEREIKNRVIRAEKTRCTGEAGICGRADDKLKITELSLQLFNHCLGRIDLSHTDGVEPDAFLSRIFSTDLSESLTPARSIAVMSYGSIDHNGAISRSDQQI